MKILVGYDGSKAAMDALKWAQRHAEAMDAKLEIVYAITRFDPKNYHEVQKAEQDLERGVKDIVNRENISYKTHVLLNELSPGDQLVKFAESNNIDEIIIGVRRRSKVGKLIIGSTAQHVILNAPCLVVTVN